MAYKWTNGGRDFFEGISVTNSSSPIIDTVAIGDGTTSPNNFDTDLDNELYSANTSSSNVIVESGSGIGEIRAIIEFTGGTEVPSDSEIVEIGFETNDGTLVYREVRDNSIVAQSGETTVLEIRAFVEDANQESDNTITNDGLNFLSDKAIGNTDDELQFVAVGEGTDPVSPSDSTMDVEIYRANKEEPNVTLSTTTNTGEINAEITVTAGTESGDDVSPGAEISEFGLITDDNTLVLHETRPAIVILENNDTKTFKIPYTIIQ